jgi:hypothetical protein
MHPSFDIEFSKSNHSAELFMNEISDGNSIIYFFSQFGAL